MPKTVNALVIRGPRVIDWTFCEVGTDLDSLQAIVGGPIECISWAGLELVLNEEGKLENLDATIALCERVGNETVTHDVIAGPVIVHGAIDNANEGAMVGLSPLQFAGLAHWRSLWRSEDTRNNIVVDGPFFKPVLIW